MDVHPPKYGIIGFGQSLVTGRPVSARLTSVARANALAGSQFPSLASSCQEVFFMKIWAKKNMFTMFFDQVWEVEVLRVLK